MNNYSIVVNNSGRKFKVVYSEERICNQFLLYEILPCKIFKGLSKKKFLNGYLDLGKVWNQYQFQIDAEEEKDQYLVKCCFAHVNLYLKEEAKTIEQSNIYNRQLEALKGETYETKEKN